MMCPPRGSSKALGEARFTGGAQRVAFGERIPLSAKTPNPVVYMKKLTYYQIIFYIECSNTNFYG
jgi:hypothetical protein